jgi:HSP20 family molecular chaperone IbpA
MASDFSTFSDFFFFFFESRFSNFMFSRSNKSQHSCTTCQQPGNMASASYDSAMFTQPCRPSPQPSSPTWPAAKQQVRQQQGGVHKQNKLPLPAAEIFENAEWIRLTVDLPGVTVQDMEVNVYRGVLTIDGVRRTMSFDGTVCIKKQKTCRRYAIDADVVDVSRVTANLRFGVLTVKAPKKPKPKKVSVNVTENEDEQNADNQVAVTMEPLTSISAVTAARLVASHVPATQHVLNENAQHTATSIALVDRTTKVKQEEGS